MFTAQVKASNLSNNFRKVEFVSALRNTGMEMEGVDFQLGVDQPLLNFTAILILRHSPKFPVGHTSSLLPELFSQ